MGNYKISIWNKIVQTFQGKEGKEFKRFEIIDMISQKFPDTNKGSISPSDYCYNITNNDFKFEDVVEYRLFKQTSRAVYKYLGPNFNYSGLVTWKGIKYGEWENGKFRKFPK